MKAVQRRGNQLVKIAQGGNLLDLSRLPAFTRFLLLADLVEQVAAHGAQQIVLIDLREALIDPLGAARQLQRGRDHHRSFQCRRTTPRQQIDQHIATQ